MKTKNFIIMIAWFWSFQCLNAQSVPVVWSEKPQAKHHFYGISADDSATIRFVGIANCAANAKPQTASLFLHKNNSPIDTLLIPLNFVGNYANIDFSFKIKAEIASYKTHFKIGSSSYMADSIKAGIVVLCNGQSNMVASYPQTLIQTHLPLDPYIASFGSSDYDPVAASASSSLVFNIGNPNATYTHRAIGLVAFYLAKTLKDSLKMPICVLNGAYGGTQVVEHLKSATVYIDSTTIYGRLLLRVKKAKITAAQIHAYFWLQGESDVLTSHTQYLNQFHQLTDSLRKDYGTNFPLFVVQIRRQACGSVLDSVLHFQELQRKLPNIAGILSTNGLMMGTDNCHFKIHSYAKLGYSMARLFLSHHQEISADKIFPQPVSASISENPYQLKLRLSNPIDTSNLNVCKNLLRVSVEGNNLNYPIAALTAIEDTIFLHFDTPLQNINHLFLSYLGSPTQDSIAIRAKTGEALPCFHHIPIEPLAPKIAFSTSSYKYIVVCVDTSVVIQANVQNVHQYFWYKNGVLLNNGTNQLQDNITTGENNYSLRVSYTQGGNLSTFSNILVLKKSEPEAIIIPDAATVFCANHPTTLHSFDTKQGNSYLWKKNSTLMQSDTLSYFMPPSSGSYSLTVIDSNTCSKTSASTTILIQPIPTANAGEDKTLCEGYKVEIGSASQANLSYAWFPNTHISNASVANPLVFPTEDCIYTLILTDIVTQCYDTQSVNIEVITTPDIPSLTATNTLVCEGTSIMLYPNTTGTSSLNWYKNDIFWQSTNVLDSLQLEDTSPTPIIYRIEAVGANGCVSNGADSLSIWIKEAPFPTIQSIPTAINNIVELCLPQTRIKGYFRAVSAPATKYQWSLSNSPIPNSNLQDIEMLLTEFDKYKFVNLEVSYANGCVRKAPSLWLNILTSGCTDSLNNEHINIVENPELLLYPIPTKDIIYIEMANVLASKGVFTCYNSLGEKIFEKKMEFIGGKGYEEVDFSTLSSGIYRLVFELNQIRIAKIVAKE